jgi:hypothetical protein
MTYPLITPYQPYLPTDLPTYLPTHRATYLYIFVKGHSSPRLAQPGGPTGFLSPSPFFYLLTKAESSFRNAVILWFYDLEDGQSPKEQVYTFITVFTRTRHWPLSWITWIQSTPSHYIYLRSILFYPSVWFVSFDNSVLCPRFSKTCVNSLLRELTALLME